MKTIILPGFSPHNRSWAESVAVEIPGAVVHPWLHWSNEVGFDPKSEVAAIIGEMGSEKVNLLAKSVGSRLAAHITAMVPGQVHRLILCGIPTVETEAQREFSAALNVLSAQNVLVIQNSADPYVPYKDAARMIQGLNPDIDVLERDRSDHHYPYVDDFKHFLAD